MSKMEWTDTAARVNEPLPAGTTVQNPLTRALGIMRECVRTLS